MRRRFEFRYGWFRWLLSVLGMGPRFSHIDIDEQELRVHMGWAFRAVIPRSAITGVHRRRAMRWGVGVHGWAGRWLVNGSVHGIAAIEVEPGVRARVIGWPIRLRELYISLSNPDEFVSAMNSVPPEH